MNPTRRAVLRGWGGIVIALPALECGVRLEGVATAAPREGGALAAANETTRPRAKRFVALMCPNGVYPQHWFPSGGERDFVLNKQNAPLESIRQHIILTKGIANKVALDAQNAGAGNGHVEGVQSLLTGRAPVPVGGNVWKVKGGRSIDQTLAAHFAANGFAARARGIHLGEEGVGGTYNTLSVQDTGDAEGTTNINVLFDTPAAMQAVENAEDSVEEGIEGIRRNDIGPNDVVIGVAASGRTPFTIAALKEAAARGAQTIGVSNNPDAPILEACSHPILADTGEEVIAGSTRMKAGTAQKIILNLLSSLIMVRLDRVYRGLMVNMRATNAKLRRRSEIMVMQITDCDEATATDAILEAGGDLKTAVLIAMGAAPSEAQGALERNNGNLRKALADFSKTA